MIATPVVHRQGAAMAVAITRLDASATDLREAAARTRDAKAARRVLAIALVLEGYSREVAAESCAMDRQTLRDWVHRYNELGLAGLFDRPRRNGPRARLSPEQQAAVAAWVEQGPELERDGVVRWRCVDLQRRIAQEFAAVRSRGKSSAGPDSALPAELATSGHHAACISSSRYGCIPTGGCDIRQCVASGCTERMEKVNHEADEALD
jgi:transposase